MLLRGRISEIHPLRGTHKAQIMRFSVSSPPCQVHKKGTMLARAAGEHLGIHAFIIETEKAGQTLEVCVAEHCTIFTALLSYLRMEAAKP